jgi:TonB family protein
MRRTIIATAAIASLGLSSPAHAEPIKLKPSSDWQLREYDDKCRMIRTFGSGEDELTLWIDKGGPGPGVNLTLIGRAVRNPYGPFVRVGFAPGEPVERNFITANSSKGRPVLGLFGVQPVSLLIDEMDGANASREKGEEQVNFAEAELTNLASEETLKQRYSAVTALELAGGVIDPITLELDGVLPMVQELGKCSVALAERLARSGSGDGGKGTPVKSKDEVIWAQKLQQNYPSHLLQAHQQGTVAVRLTVNKDGKPTFCEVTHYSGPASFNDSACLQLLRHAQFTPATDAAGNPVAGFYSTRITYRLN